MVNSLQHRSRALDTARVRRDLGRPRPPNPRRRHRTGGLAGSDAPRRRALLPDLFTWTNFDVAWSQRYAVTTLCRMLHTLDCGQVTSKRAALLWAADTVDPRWSSLIHQVLDDRERGWDPHERPRPGSVECTLAFADFAKDVAARPPK